MQISRAGCPRDAFGKLSLDRHSEPAHCADEISINGSGKETQISEHPGLALLEYKNLKMTLTNTKNLNILRTRTCNRSFSAFVSRSIVSCSGAKATNISR